MINGALEPDETPRRKGKEVRRRRTLSKPLLERLSQAGLHEVAEEGFDDVDVVGEEIEEILRLQGEDDGLLFGDRVGAAQPAAQDFRHAEGLERPEALGLPLRILDADLAADHAVQNIRRAVLLVNLFSRPEVTLPGDRGDSKDLLGLAERKKIAALQEDDDLDSAQFTHPGRYLARPAVQSTMTANSAAGPDGFSSACVMKKNRSPFESTS